MTRVPAVGIGVGPIPSVGIGSSAVHRPRMPLRYDLVITFRDEKGSIKDYRIAFGCNRSYIIDDKTVRNVDELVEWENMLSANTNRHLGEICAYLEAFKKESFSNDNLHDVDVASLFEESEALRQKKQVVLSAHRKAAKIHSTKRGTIATVIGAILTILGVIIFVLIDLSNPYFYIVGGAVSFVAGLALVALGIKKIKE